MGTARFTARDFIQVTTTVPDQQLAEQMGRQLVEKQLAACVQIEGPALSIYRWQGKIESAREYQCTAKVRAARFVEVVAAITELHPYDVPEIIATSLAHVSDAYGEWLDQELI